MTLERKCRPGERNRSVGRTGFREMIASGWRTAPPQVVDFEVVMATNSACLLSLEASPVFPMYHVSPNASSLRPRQGQSCSNTSHRLSSPVHALPHPASCPLHGEPSLALAPGQLPIVLCLGLPLAP